MFVNPAPIVVTESGVAITQTTATLNATVNPNGGEVTECKFEYGTTTAYGKTDTCCLAARDRAKAQTGRRDGAAHGPDREHDLPLQDLGDERSGGTSKGSGRNVHDVPNPPTVVTEKATAITQTTATLNATVNPNGGDGDRMQIRIRHHDRLRENRQCAVAARDRARQARSRCPRRLTGLTANTDLPLPDRRDATPAGTSQGGDETFTTLPNPPTVVTEAATSITQTTATLNATVNPNGGTVTECKFEYGTTTAYGKTATCASLPGTGRTSPVACPRPIRASPRTPTYHFRIVATNTGGTGEGADETFTTLPNPPTVVTKMPRRSRRRRRR